MKQFIFQFIRGLCSFLAGVLWNNNIENFWYVQSMTVSMIIILIIIVSITENDTVKSKLKHQLTNYRSSVKYGFEK